ncbi:MAG: hypothetical protein VW707_03905, partial [Candidatus Puniceispirillum sp.]
MDGVIDLSAEALDISKATPSCIGRGWLAGGVTQADWVVSLDDAALDEIAVMVMRMQQHPLP